jgi:hypothetical protein
VKSFSYSPNASWAILEMIRYFVFLEKYADKFTSLVTWASFKQMAEFV